MCLSSSTMVKSSTDLSFVIGILSLIDSLFFSKISNADVFWLSAYCAIRFHLVIPGEVLCNNGCDMILSEFISNFWKDLFWLSDCYAIMLCLFIPGGVSTTVALKILLWCNSQWIHSFPMCELLKRSVIPLRGWYSTKIVFWEFSTNLHPSVTEFMLYPWVDCWF